MFLRSLFFSRPRGRLRDAIIFASLLVILLFHSLTSLKDSRKIGPERPSDEHPHYTHKSTFHKHPDLEYERSLSNAMRDIENKEQELHGNDKATDYIWQMLLKDKPTYKNRGDDSLLLEALNEEWNYKLVTGEWAEEFVTITLSSIPGLASIYHSYPHFVQRSDLLRYLILWYYGGYYADMDVFPVHPIKQCPAMEDSIFKKADPDVSLVLGIEIDEPFASSEKMNYWHWVRRYGFLQYTIYAPRRFSPLLREVIVRVISHTRQHLDQSSILLGPKYSELDTLEITGPGVFTDAILDILSDSLPDSHPLVVQSVQADTGIGDLGSLSPGATRKRVSWAPFHSLQQTLCVENSETEPAKEFGGLCVLPINTWANGQRHSKAEGFNSKQACINHRFGGTWKPWRQTWSKYLFG